jgi:dextranase
MKAIAYGAVYAACEQFAQQHQDWRMFAGKTIPLRFIDVFSIMNPASPWGNHIIEEYRSATALGFDGIHMDTYGFPKIAFDNEGNPVYLETELPRLITRTREALPDATLIFNNVGGWPLEKTMNTAVDAVYVEVWPPYSKYYHLKQIGQSVYYASPD